MTEPNLEDRPDLSKLNYSHEKLLELWEGNQNTRGIRDILRDEGRLCGEEIADKLEDAYFAYGKKTIQHDILPKMRTLLEGQHIITVEAVPGEHGKITKKEWVLR
ncbi:hypothetical protein G3I44_14310 [Halogeometricum borinquense]|uniref:Uncharacterized protein n=1 Tax=Halogeometricum borinquense TaxID=60847 RepID=A0A6C0UN86_9EURY|nr:hypothetical protein [Halogeometricum borinquense]QIB75359.1 hypothetical protein G3I44_14310 [Halogeometricum borinquense]